MRRRLYLGSLSGFISFVVLNTSAAARAQTAPLAGQLMSAGTAVGASSTATALTTPSSGHFVLTQACGGSSMQLAGSTFRLIATMTSDVLCYPFSVGYALPANEAIRCTNPLSGSPWCSVSGVRTK
jgi:hypothetical protein